jgi:hypothetical protein
MDQVGAEYGDILREARQHGLADTECLDCFFVGAGEKVLVVRSGEPEYIAETM